MTKSVKAEHYVPKSYLQRFSTDDKICAYNIKTNEFIKTNVNKIAKKNYFYDLDINELRTKLNSQKKFLDISDEEFEELTNDEQFIEKAFSKLEGKTKTYLDELEKKYNLIKDKDFLSTLFVFLHTLSLRTLNYRKKLEKIAEQTTNWLQSINIKEANYPLNLSPDEIAKQNQLSEILSFPNAHRKSKSFFGNYDIFIGINDSQIDFLISDNPLLYFSLGFNDICFPVNPKLAIIMQVKSAPKEFKICELSPDENSIVHLNTKDVIKYNVLQQNTDATYLFGSELMLKVHLNIIKYIKQLEK